MPIQGGCGALSCNIVLSSPIMREGKPKILLDDQQPHKQQTHCDYKRFEINSKLNLFPAIGDNHARAVVLFTLLP